MSYPLAYLFERFPTFTQTFCVREVAAVRHQAQWQVPIYSIRKRLNEHQQDLPADLQGITRYVPNVEGMARRWMTPYSFRARAAKRQLLAAWGPEGDRNRAYEAAWLGPRLLRDGVCLVHVHFTGLAARTAFWLKQLYGIEYSVTAHANDFMVRTKHARLDDIFSDARFVVTVSDYSLNILRQTYPKMAGKIYRVYNGIQVGSFPQAQFQVPPTIVSIGRYIAKKGFFDLIEACALLRDVDFRCLLIGEGELREEMQQRIAALHLENKVIVTGPKSESEIKKILAQASLFALACQSEADGGMDNLPTVIMEAMAARLPVVSTRLAGVPEMVQDGQTGFLVQERDVPALAERMRRLLSNLNLSRQMGEMGYQLALERFDISQTSKQLIEIFEKQLSSAERQVRSME